MNDLKSLVESIKSNPNNSSQLTSAYHDTVDELTHKPAEYLAQLEYIITSGYGLRSFEEFVCNNRIPFAFVESIIDLINEKYDSATEKGMSPNPYENIKAKFESLVKTHPNTFCMIDRYIESVDDGYLKEFYSFLETKNCAKLYSRYGKVSIADILYNESSFEDSTMFIESAWSLTNPEVAEVMFNILPEGVIMREYAKTLGNDEMMNILNHVFEASYSSMVVEINNREQKMFQEYVERMNTSIHERYEPYHFTESDLAAYKNYYSFIESQLQFGICTLDDANKVFNKIVEITEAIESYGENNKGYTANKKSGKSPDYLRTNHDMDYGERDKDETEDDINSDLPDAEPNVGTSMPSAEELPEPEKDEEEKPKPREPWNLGNVTPASTVYNYHYYNSFNTSSKSGSDNVIAADDHSNRSRNSNHNIKTYNTGTGNIKQPDTNVTGKDDDTKTESALITESKHYKYTRLRIDNSAKAAVNNGIWVKPGAGFYNRMLNSFDGEVPDDVKEYEKALASGAFKDWMAFLKEAYLIVGDVKNSPYGITPYSRSGCKYPHHVIRGSKLVVSKPGLIAAYKRAKQQGVYSGDVKEHLDRHFKELGLEQYIGTGDSGTKPDDKPIKESTDMFELNPFAECIDYDDQENEFNSQDDYDSLDGYSEE